MSTSLDFLLKKKGGSILLSDNNPAPTPNKNEAKTSSSSDFLKSKGLTYRTSQPVVANNILEGSIAKGETKKIVIPPGDNYIRKSGGSSWGDKEEAIETKRESSIFTSKASLLSKAGRALSEITANFVEGANKTGLPQIGGAIVGAGAGIIGGITGAVGQPIVNMFQGKPVFKDEWKSIKNNAVKNAQFGYQTGKQGVPMGLIGAGLGELGALGTAGRITETGIGAGFTVQMGTDGVKQVTEGIKTHNPEMITNGIGSLGMGLMGVFGMVDGTKNIKFKKELTTKIADNLKIQAETVTTKGIEITPVLVKAATDRAVNEVVAKLPEKTQFELHDKLVKMKTETVQPETNLKLTENIKPVIPKELEPLAVEARKYKSAEEFSNDYLSKADKFESLPKSKEIIDWENAKEKARAEQPTLIKKLQDIQAKYKGVPDNKIPQEVKAEFVKLNKRVDENIELKGSAPPDTYFNSGDMNLKPKLENFYNQAVDKTKPIPEMTNLPKPVEPTAETKQSGVAKAIEAISPKIGKVATPAEYLYHGTNEMMLDSISKDGLKPMGRGELSLSKDETYAKSFAKDGMTPQGKTNSVMLRVKSGALEGKTTLNRTDGKARPMSDQLNEVMTKETISPGSLEIYKNGEWLPLKPAETVVKTPETKTSKVAKSIELKTTEQGLSDTFGDLAEYTPVTIKEQAKLADDLIKTDFEKAKRIISGEEPLPKEMLGGTLIKAMEDHALKTKDAQLAMDIAKSPLTSETSVHAQEMRMLAERNPDSAVVKIREVIKAREEMATKRTKGKDLTEAKKGEVAKIKSEIKKAISPKETWGSFIDSITC